MRAGGKVAHVAPNTPQAQGADGLKEQYLLRYLLEVETRGNQSLLNVQAFSDPTAYKLKVKRPGSDESREVNVDLLETFNWLIGLTVQHIAVPQLMLGVRRTEGEMDARTPKMSYPDRKISETFLDFAAPMLHDLPRKAREQRAKDALQVAFTAWNAVVFADVLNDHHYLDEIRSLMADKTELALLMEPLIARKRALFGDDERLIGTWEVTKTWDGINLRADARDPHAVPRNPK